MNTTNSDESIRILVVDDDEHILACYQDAFGETEETDYMKALDALDAELFDPEEQIEELPRFDLVSCSQGREAVALAEAAANDGQPFDVVILDVRMPPGIDGVAAGTAIREIDPDVEIVFVTGFSDVELEELQRRVPPPLKLHYFHKPISFMQLAEDVAGMIATQQG